MLNILKLRPRYRAYKVRVFGLSSFHVHSAPFLASHFRGPNWSRLGVCAAVLNRLWRCLLVLLLAYVRVLTGVRRAVRRAQRGAGAAGAGGRGRRHGPARRPRGRARNGRRAQGESLRLASCMMFACRSVRAHAGFVCLVRGFLVRLLNEDR